jgi:O-acetylserine/cysteine efflux transporter
MHPIHVILAIVASAVWGVNFVAAKAAVLHFPPLLLLATRMFLVALILLPFLKRVPIPLWRLVSIAFVFTVLHFGFMFAGLARGVDVSVAVIVDQLRIPFAVLFGYLLLHERIHRRDLVGIAVALLGSACLIGVPNVIGNFAGFIMVMVGAISWAFYNILVKHVPMHGAISFIGWMALLGAPQLLLLSLYFESDHVSYFVQMPSIVMASLLYLVFASTIFAHGCWYYLLQYYPVSQIVPFSLLIPVFGMIASIALLEENITMGVIVGGALTVLGVAIVVSKGTKKVEL